MNRKGLFQSVSCAQLIAVVLLSGCGRSTSRAPDAATTVDSTAARDPVGATKPDSALVALGNEPFWSVRLTSREILYRDPEHQDGYRFPSVDPVAEGDARVYRTRRDIPADDPGPRTLELRIRRGTCSDGMSDRQYPMTAELKMGNQTYTGCAWYQPDAPPKAPK
jgi:uncharacterized membrane protein